MNTEVCLIRADTQPAGEAGKQPRHCRPPRAQRPDPSSWPPAEPHPTSGAPTDAGAGDMVGCRIRPHGSGPATSTEGSQPVPGPAPWGARHSPAPHRAAASPPPLGHATGAGEPRGWTLGAPVLRGAPGAKAVLGQPRAPPAAAWEGSGARSRRPGDSPRSATRASPGPGTSGEQWRYFLIRSIRSSSLSLPRQLSSHLESLAAIICLLH